MLMTDRRQICLCFYGSDPDSTTAKKDASEVDCRVFLLVETLDPPLSLGGVE